MKTATILKLYLFTLLKAIQSDYLLNISVVYFYKGEFQETLESLGKIESLHHFNKGVRDLYSSAYYQLYFLSKLFRQEEYDIDAIVANMRLLKPRSKKQQAIINQRLSIIQSLHEVVKDRKSSDFLETLVPHNELERLVYSYYQALNAQVLGNEEKVQEHFLLLSKLNDDFYYVREAKEFLDERFQELQENYDELTDSIVHEHLKNDGGSDVRSQ